jgi:hypothetical protein
LSASSSAKTGFATAERNPTPASSAFPKKLRDSCLLPTRRPSPRSKTSIVKRTRLKPPHVHEAQVLRSEHSGKNIRGMGVSSGRRADLGSSLGRGVASEGDGLLRQRYMHGALALGTEVTCGRTIPLAGSTHGLWPQRRERKSSVLYVPLPGGQSRYRGGGDFCSTRAGHPSWASHGA